MSKKYTRNQSVDPDGEVTGHFDHPRVVRRTRLYFEYDERHGIHYLINVGEPKSRQNPERRPDYNRSDGTLASIRSEDRTRTDPS